MRLMATRLVPLASEPRPQPLSSGYIPALDGVRGIAICAVLFVHSFPIVTAALPQETARMISRIGDVGAFGVDLFFVLSGFLITGILIDTRSSPRYFRNFYARRFLRLFPLYYLYLAFVALLLPWLHAIFRTSIPDYNGNWWWYLLYFCNWKTGNAVGDPSLGHFWSLAVEEQFYLVWPAIVLLLSRRYLVLCCGAVTLLSLGLRLAWAHDNVYWNVIYRLTVTRLDTLALGALAALAVRSQRWRPLCEKYSGAMILAGMGTFAMIVALVGSASWEEKPIQTIGAFAAAVGFTGLVLGAALYRSGPLYRFLMSPVLTAYGKYSYGIYVYHVVVLLHCDWIASWIVRHSPWTHLMAPITIVVMANIAVFFIARSSYLLFEKPILSYKARFRD
jgi:peptidoglycan/LPS O-acetylase OafA/YrhL